MGSSAGQITWPCMPDCKKSLGGQQRDPQLPDPEETIVFWKKIWDSLVNCNNKASWIKDTEEEVQEKSKPNN